MLAWFVTSCSVDNSVAPVTNEQQTITTEILEDGTVVEKEEYVYAEDEDWGIDIGETVDFPKLVSDNNKGIGILKSQGNGRKIVRRWNVTWFWVKKGKRLGIIKRCFFVRYSDGTTEKVGDTSKAKVSGVTISPSGSLYYKIEKGTSATFSATVDISSPSLPQQKKVTWTSSNSGKIKINANNSQANITISDDSLNSFTITATSKEDSSKSDSVNINKLTLDLSSTPSGLVLLPLDSRSLNITGTAICNDANRNITYQWSKDGSNILGANSSSYTATSEGKYTLKASVVDDKGETLSESVTVVVDEAECLGCPADDNDPYPIQLEYQETIKDISYTKTSTPSDTKTLYIAKAKNDIKIKVIFGGGGGAMDITAIRWSGMPKVSDYNGNISCFVENNESSQDGTLKMSYVKDDKNITIEMDLKFVTITAVEENSKQKYGFDDYSVKVYNSSTSSYIEDVIWKSVAENDNDSFYITLSHPKAWKEINDNANVFIGIADTSKLKSVNVATGNAKSKITVNSDSKGDTSFNLSLAGGKLEYEVTGNSDGNPPPANKKIKRYSDFGVVVYKKREVELSVRVVNDSKHNLMVPANHQFRNMQPIVNKYFQQAVVNWKITYNSTGDVAYDKDSNGYLDNDSSIQNNNGELYTIYNTYKDSKTYNLFIVKYVKGASKDAVGYVPDTNNDGVFFNDKYIFVETKSANYDDFTHELGHSISLHHMDYVGNIFNLEINQVKNLMYSSRESSSPNFTQIKLLKKQWDKINP